MDIKDLLLIVDRLSSRVFDSLAEGGERIRRAEGSTGSLLLLGLIFFMCFLLAGGPFVLVYRPALLYRAENTFGATFVSSDALTQGAIEGFIVGVLYLLGMGGLYWLYSSSRGGRPSSIVAILAISCIAIATILLFLVSSWKS